MYSLLDGSASTLKLANRKIEITLVGPDTRCQLEPKSAARIAGTIAAYSPYCGGRPASVANATPCGSTMTAPASAAMPSARRVSRLTMGHQRKNGNMRGSQGWWGEFKTVLPAGVSAERAGVRPLSAIARRAATKAQIRV